MSKIWIIVWIVACAYFLVAAHGKGCFPLSAVSILAGFMLAREISHLINGNQ